MASPAFALARGRLSALGLALLVAACSARRAELPPAEVAATPEGPPPVAIVEAEVDEALPPSKDQRKSVAGWKASAPPSMPFRVSAPCTLRGKMRPSGSGSWSCEQRGEAKGRVIWRVSVEPVPAPPRDPDATLARLREAERDVTPRFQASIDRHRVREARAGGLMALDRALEGRTGYYELEVLSRFVLADGRLFTIEVLSQERALPRESQVFLNSFDYGELNPPAPTLPTPPEIKSAKLRHSLRHGGDVFRVAWSPDGSKLASASNDGTIGVWSLKSGKRIHRMRTKGGATGVAWSPDGQRLASVDFGGTLVLWDASNGKKLGEHHLGGRLRDVDFDPQTGELLVVGDGTGFSNKRAPDGSEHTTRALPQPIRAWGVTYDRSGQTFSTIGGGSVSLWTTDGESLWSAEIGGSAMWSHAFSPTGAFVAGPHDVRGAPTVRIWEAATGEVVADTVFHPDAYILPSVAWASNGWLAAGDGMGRVMLWRPQDSRPTVAATGLRSNVITLEFSPDGSMLAAAGYDNVIKIWSLTAG